MGHVDTDLGRRIRTVLDAIIVIISHQQPVARLVELPSNLQGYGHETHELLTDPRRIVVRSD